MITRLRVTNYERSVHIQYDAFFCSIGYEQRSQFVAKHVHEFCKKKYALGFDYHHKCSFLANESWFRQHGFLEWCDSDRGHLVKESEFSDLFLKLLVDATSAIRDRVPYIGIDISSMSSIRLASVLNTLREHSLECDLVVNFFYAPGEGHDTSKSDEQIEFAGPVTPEFAGWSIEPEAPVIAIFGLGLEYDRSIGAFELLNPAAAYAFATTGVNDALDKQINNANRLFYPLVSPSNQFSFDVLRPMDCFSSMRSVASGALRDGRPVFVPIGPKIFTLCSLLIAIEYSPFIGVWRISSGQHGEPQDIKPLGEYAGLTVEFRGQQVTSHNFQNSSAFYGVR